MTANVRKFFPCLCLLAAALLLSCTENPFGSDSEISSKRTVSGTVELVGSSTQSGAYVWLEGLNLGTFTDREGNFEITLPSPGSQPGGGLTGAANLYYFVANYRLRSDQLILRNGEFLYSQGPLNEQGRLVDPVILTPLIDVDVQITPASFSTSYDSSLEVTTIIDVRVDEQQVLTVSTDLSVISVVLVEQLGSSGAFLRTLLSGPGRETITTLERGRHELKTRYFVTPNFLPAGSYQAIPYVWVLQDDLPAALIESLGAQYRQYSQDYIKIPFRRNGGQFSISMRRNRYGCPRRFQTIRGPSAGSNSKQEPQ